MRGAKRLAALACALLLLPGAPARALDIQLVSGNWQPINIFIEPFIGEEQLPPAQAPSGIIGRDLAASGHFRVIREAQNTFGDVSDKRLADLRARGGEYMLTGRLRRRSGDHALTFSLHDVLTGSEVGKYSTSLAGDTARLSAHNIANWVYEKITGRPGVFHTKIAYVLRLPDGENQLKIADYDGHQRLTILSSGSHIISPAWAPDGNSLLYVSFEQDKPVIYRQSLLTGNREIIANFKGSNSAPAIAPDNRTVAAALTEHGGVQQIYLLSGSRKSRLRASKGINTEPAFSPDGGRIAFTSDDSGSPQIYEYNLQTRAHRRLTYGSSYNVSPDYSSTGDTLALVQRGGGGDNIVLLDIRSGSTSPLTDVRLADSPSFAPNDDIVSFVSETSRKRLATVSVNGRIVMSWENPEEGRIIDPVWSPLQSDWF